MAETDALQISPDVVFEVLDGEAVLLNMRSGIYFRLNPTGTRVWKMLEAREGLERIIDAITDEFDVSREDVRADVDALVSQLIERGLLTRQP